MIMVIMFYYNFISMIRGKKRLSKLRQDAFDDIENERKRIANELHDISAFSILKIKENLNKNLNAPIPEIENQLFSSIYDLQNELNLSIENLYPRDLLLHDWQNSIKRLCSGLSQVVNIECNIQVISQLQSQISIQLYRIVQEHLSNIVKHVKPNFIQLFIDEFEAEMFIEFLYPVDSTKMDFKKTSQSGRGKIILEERYKMLDIKFEQGIKGNMKFEKLNFTIK